MRIRRTGIRCTRTWSGLAALAVAEPSFAGFTNLGEPLTIVWLAVAAALVFLMRAGFALLESGMACSKNSINVIMKNYSDMAVGALAFWVLGFGVLYGANPSGWIGMSLFLPELNDSGDAIFFLYQTMFAATAATIISGAVAERIRFAPYVVLSLVVTTLIYPISGSWAWGGLAGGAGWLSELGFHDVDKARLDNATAQALTTWDGVSEPGVPPGDNASLRAAVTAVYIALCEDLGPAGADRALKQAKRSAEELDEASLVSPSELL